MSSDTGILSFGRRVSAVLGVGFLAAAVAAQTNYELVHVFHPSGTPSKLIQATDGHYYGTTYFGGTSGVGTIFRIDSDGNLTTVHSFAYADGANPSGGLIQCFDGNFYGTTTVGGKNNRGTVYRMDPSFHVTVLHSFGGDDGAGPFAAPSQADDGNLYGTTASGGAADAGTVWGIIDGTFTTLHHFQGEAQDGGNVRGALIAYGEGHLLGTTPTGGYDGFGTIFYANRYGQFETVYAFVWPDLGVMPIAGLTQGPDGLYGTTTFGGEHGGGTVFRYDGELTVLHSFYGESGIEAELIAGLDGYLYGASPWAGPTSSGTVFKMSPSGEMTVLHTFDGTSGAGPSTSLLQTTDGYLYGTTMTGDGWRWAGSVFRLDEAGTMTNVHVFRGDDALSPEAGLIEGEDGRLYGAAMGGENNRGAVFRVDPSNALTVIHSFDGADGSYPRAALLQAVDGDFYGTTSSGGENDLGTVFRMQSSGEVTTIHSFDGPQGQAPNSALIQTPEGSLYGTTTRGGTEGAGTVFRIDAAGSFTMLDSLSGDDGAYPGPLVRGEASLYGNAWSGGAHSFGTIFEIDSSGTLEACHAFDGTEGAHPLGEMIRATDGNFYGTANGGGVTGHGTVYRMNVAEELTTLHTFQGGEDGSGPRAGLIQATDGNFYGTTGGTGAGTIFRMDIDGNVTTLHVLHAIDGATPDAQLVQASDGHIYGTTLGGGPIFYPTSGVDLSRGVVFRLGWSQVAVNRVTPGSGDASGGIALNLLGGGFSVDSIVNVGGVPGTDVTVLDPTFLYLFSPALMPGTLNDVSVTIPNGAGGPVTNELPKAFFADFVDVPQLNPFHDDVEKIFRNGITAGCAPGSYCPQDAVTRAQMAVFLLKSKHGSTFVPPACAGVFSDVPCPGLFADWIEQLAAEGITAGCGNGNYCPSSAVTRAQMAVFLLKAKYGSAYMPPACTGVFADVACPSLFAAWIERLAAEEITGGCGGGNYCPENPNTRAQMSAFLVKAFGM